MKPGAMATLALTGLSCAAATAGDPSRERTFEERHQAFQKTLERLDRQRQALYREWTRAGNAKKKDEVRDKARSLLVRSIVDEIVPVWVGMPWTRAVIDDGLRPDAAHPFERGKGISSWKEDIHRYYGITPERLKAKLHKLGDGLYAVGLNCHIGLLHVKGEEVDFLHSSYVSPEEVVIEPLTESPAIRFSEEAGYVVSPLFQDRRLIDHWLSGTRIPFQKRGVR